VCSPLPFTVTVGRLPELVAVALLDARATNSAGVATALASAAAAATIAIAHFILNSVGGPLMSSEGSPGVQEMLNEGI